MRILNLIGPRQGGKSTLVRDMLPSAGYITLDDVLTRRALSADVFGQLSALSARAAGSGLPIVIDEVQVLPEIVLALKRIVDRDPRRGHFILTGSSDIFTAPKAIDTLAGRQMTLLLRPFSAAEISGSGPCLLLDAVAQSPRDPIRLFPRPRPLTRSGVIDLIVRGGFPEFRDLADVDRMDRCSGYVDTIIERDLSAIHAVRNPDAVRRLVFKLAARTGQELRTDRLARDLGVKFETVGNYIDALTRLGIVLRLGAWTSSKAKREIKAPKLHVMDTGLATALRGEDADSFGLDADPTSLGALFETFVFVELEKALPFLSKRWSLWHWRDKTHEVDILAEAPGRLLALFEMKASSSVDERDFRHMDWFISEGPGKDYRGARFVVHLGDTLAQFGPGRIALPASMLWSYADTRAGPVA